MAVVGDLFVDVDQHDGGAVDHFPGGAHITGDGKSKREDSCRSGRRHQYWQWRWTNFLGVGLRFDDPEDSLFHDVPYRGCPLLDLPHHWLTDRVGHCHVHRGDVLWGRLWHYPGVRG